MTEAGKKTLAEAIRDRLPKSHDGRFGFPIFRVSYDDDTAFARFIELLTAHANAGLDEDDTGDQIKDLLHWDIWNDEAQLRGASIDQVRK